MPMSNAGTFTLIQITPSERKATARVTPRSVGEDPVGAFEELATAIQMRDKCHRVTALQRACDENPDKFSEYCRAFGTVL